MHFWCESTGGSGYFFALVDPRTLVHKFSTEANKLQLPLPAVLIEMHRSITIFREITEENRILFTLKQKLFRLSDRSKLKSRVTGRIKCTDLVRNPFKRGLPLLKDHPCDHSTRLPSQNTAPTCPRQSGSSHQNRRTAHSARTLTASHTRTATQATRPQIRISPLRACWEAIICAFES